MDNLQECIYNIKSGQKEAYKEVVDFYKGSIYGYLYRMVSCHQDAEDLTQDTFTTAYYKINQLKNVDAFKSWLFSIAYSQAQQHFRRKKINDLVIEKLKVDKKEVVTQKEDNDLLEALHAILSSYDMTLLCLRVVEEMSFAELSICLNKKPSTLRKQYERLRHKLRVQLEEKKEGIIYEY